MSSPYTYNPLGGNYNYGFNGANLQNNTGYPYVAPNNPQPPAPSPYPLNPPGGSYNYGWGGLNQEGYPDNNGYPYVPNNQDGGGLPPPTGPQYDQRGQNYSQYLPFIGGGRGPITSAPPVPGRGFLGTPQNGGGGAPVPPTGPAFPNPGVPQQGSGGMWDTLRRGMSGNPQTGGGGGPFGLGDGNGRGPLGIGNQPITGGGPVDQRDPRGFLGNPANGTQRIGPGSGVGVVGGIPEGGGNNEPLRYPNEVDFNGRKVYVDDLGHGDYGEGYDSLGHINYGGMGTGPTEEEMTQEFNTLKAGGLVFWPGSYSTWFAAGKPLANQLTDAEKNILMQPGGDWNKVMNFRMNNPNQPPPGNGQQPPPGTPPPPGTGNPPNWLVPGIGNGPWNPNEPVRPHMPPQNGGDFWPLERPLGPPMRMGPDGKFIPMPPSGIQRDATGKNQGYHTGQPISAYGGQQGAVDIDALISNPAALQAMGIDPQAAINGGAEFRQYLMGMAEQEKASPGTTMLRNLQQGGFQPNLDSRNFIGQNQQGQQMVGGQWNPQDAYAGRNFLPPNFVQPSYDQKTFPGLDDAEFQRLLAFNNNMALPWSQYLAGRYENDRDYGEDVRRFGLNFGEDRRRYDQGFGEDQFRDRRNFDTDVFRDSRDYGENVRRYDEGFGEDRRRFDTNFGEDTRRFDLNRGDQNNQWGQEFGEGQRQFNQNFGENQRQFNQNLDWTKISDAMRTFGARQMPNVRQVSFR
jgi:hypothetical protein